MTKAVIHIDESGYTGADYLNKDQPIFVLTASWYTSDECLKIIEGIKKNYAGNEIKFSKLIKTDRGTANLVQTIKELNKDCFSSYIVHKESILVRKFVDDCIEPFLNERGVNLYANGGQLAYANVISSTIPTFMGRDWYSQFLKLYNMFIREKTDDRNRALWEHCRQAISNHNAIEIFYPYVASPMLAMQEVNTQGYTESIYESIFLGLIIHLRNEFGIKKFEVIYDVTKATTNEKLLKFLRVIAGLGEEYKVSDVCTLHGDIVIESVRAEDSKTNNGIQVSDLISGTLFNTFKDVGNLETLLGKSVLVNLKDKNVIHLINSNNVTPESLGMKGSVNPWLK